MIFDGFMFSNEFELLELRLQELFEVVDRFVVVEATRTHQGHEKPLLFAEHRERFRPYMDKIVHVVVDDMPPHDGPWTLEFFQRNAIMRGLYAASDDDFVIVGDVDEIPRPHLIAELATRQEEVVGFQMTLSCFKYNYLCIEGEAMLVWSVATRARHLRRLGPQYFREKRHFLHNANNMGALLPEFFTVLPHAGWHFGWIGDRESALHKLQHTNHQEFNTEGHRAALDIDAIIAAGGDIFGRKGYRWSAMQLSDYFPATLVQNREKYAANIIG